MHTYLLKIKPLEPFTFGTDQRFAYPDSVQKTGKESSYVNSNLLPEQTTLLGMLRFLILEQKKILKSNFSYSKEEREIMNKWIGKESFKFQSSRESIQNFGVIKSISPVFLMKDNDYYIKNPFHYYGGKNAEKIAKDRNTNSKEEVFLKMGQEVRTSSGKISLPINYNPKDGYAQGFVNLQMSTLWENDDIFVREYITGNKKTLLDEERNEAFFKREIVQFKKDFSFAIFVDIETELPQKMIGFMGLKKSAFSIEVIETKNDLQDKIRQSVLNKTTEKWYYALSDLYVEDKSLQEESDPSFKYDTFCIVKQKQLRNLETKLSDKQEPKNENKFINRMQLRESKVNLIESGSVFYQKCSLDLENENVKQIGYNHIIELGGN